MFGPQNCSAGKNVIRASVRHTFPLSLPASHTSPQIRSTLVMNTQKKSIVTNLQHLSRQTNYVGKNIRLEENAKFRTEAIEATSRKFLLLVIDD